MTQVSEVLAVKCPTCGSMVGNLCKEQSGLTAKRFAFARGPVDSGHCHHLTKVVNSAWTGKSPFRVKQGETSWQPQFSRSRRRA